MVYCKACGKPTTDESGLCSESCRHYDTIRKNEEEFLMLRFVESLSRDQRDDLLDILQSGGGNTLEQMLYY